MADSAARGPAVGSRLVSRPGLVAGQPWASRAGAWLIYGPVIYRFARETRGHGVSEVKIAVVGNGGRFCPKVRWPIPPQGSPSVLVTGSSCWPASQPHRGKRKPPRSPQCAGRTGYA